MSDFIGRKHDSLFYEVRCFRLPRVRMTAKIQRGRTLRPCKIFPRAFVVLAVDKPFESQSPALDMSVTGKT